MRHPDPLPWLLLHHAPGLGPVAARRLVETVGDAAGVLAAPGEAVRAASLPGSAARALAGIDPRVAERAQAWAAAAPRRHLLAWPDPRYPALLREIADPPLVLYCAGSPQALAGPTLAVVGSRRPTPAGREIARELAASLAGSGLVLASGLALGIDAQVHEATLSVEGRTVAVLGTGADLIYPARHAELARGVVESGAVITELPPGAPARAGNFPRRNRILSGIALGVLVIEAAARSGSLITARLAGEQGREVFAVPGSIHSPLSRGCHRLIRDGAKLVEGPGDVLEELGPLAGVRPSAAPAPAPSGDFVGTLDETERRLLSCLESHPVTFDRIVERCGLTPEVVSSMLLALELRGFVCASPGGRYALASPRPRG